MPGMKNHPIREGSSPITLTRIAGSVGRIKFIYSLLNRFCIRTNVFTVFSEIEAHAEIEANPQG